MKIVVTSVTVILVSVVVSRIVAAVSEGERLETDVVFVKRTEGAMTGTREYVSDMLLVSSRAIVGEDVQAEVARVEVSP